MLKLVKNQSFGVMDFQWRDNVSFHEKYPNISLEKKCKRGLILYFWVTYPFKQTQPWSIFVFLRKVNGGENCVCLATHCTFPSVSLKVPRKQPTLDSQEGLNAAWLPHK